MTLKSTLLALLRFVALWVLFAVFFVAGSSVMLGVMPNTVSERGLLPDNVGLLVIITLDTLLISALILTSRWHGWKLAAGLALAYYGAATFLGQIETWYFLSNLTVPPEALPRLFLMGLPVAFIFIPLAVWILGKGRGAVEAHSNAALDMPWTQWLWKLAAIALAYVLLYWGAGYFIAWQNPAVRAFYGHPGEITPFWTHTANTLRNDPGLFPFQLMRGLLWTLCALPILRGSRVNLGWTALLVGLLLSVPMNLSHILSNPFIPSASVRLSHLIETASSTFVFGLIATWLLHRQHQSIRDLFGLKNEAHPVLPIASGHPPRSQSTG